MTRHTYVISFDTEKDITDLPDHITHRIYTMDGVKKGDMSCTRLDVYLDDVRKRVDVKPLEVRSTEKSSAAAFACDLWREYELMQRARPCPA